MTMEVTITKVVGTPEEIHEWQQLQAASEVGADQAATLTDEDRLMAHIADKIPGEFASALAERLRADGYDLKPPGGRTGVGRSYYHVRAEAGGATLAYVHPRRVDYMLAGDDLPQRLPRVSAGAAIQLHDPRTNGLDVTLSRPSLADLDVAVELVRRAAKVRRAKAIRR